MASGEDWGEFFAVAVKNLCGISDTVVTHTYILTDWGQIPLPLLCSKLQYRRKKTLRVYISVKFDYLRNIKENKLGGEWLI